VCILRQKEKKLTAPKWKHKTAAFLYRKKVVIVYCTLSKRRQEVTFCIQRNSPEYRHPPLPHLLKWGEGELKFSKILLIFFSTSWYRIIFPPYFVHKTLYFT
jgi:hypothetical protein